MHYSKVVALLCHFGRWALGFLGFHELSFKQLPALGNCGHCLWLNDKCFTFPNLENSYGADFAGINFVDLFLQRFRQVAYC